MKTGNTSPAEPGHAQPTQASMEPGHEDREYMRRAVNSLSSTVRPQWSPVMKTGNTAAQGGSRRQGSRASMEPGHEDREYMDAPPPPLKE